MEDRDPYITGGSKMNLIIKAYEFAFAAHEGQVRKYMGQPYISHPIMVAGFVFSVTNDEDMIAAALLHDTVEDTYVTFEDVEECFGKRICGLVKDLTDISNSDDGLRKHRKALDLQHTAAASPDAKTIKLADLIHNTESILHYDPEFAKVYMREKRALLEVLKEGNETLYKQAKKIVDNYFEQGVAR